MEEERVEGAEGAAVVGEPEKCNTVTFVGADGMEQSFPLDFLLERGAIVANRVNGEDIMSVMGATNQLWVPGLPAKYFVRDIREIRFTNEEVPPVIGPFVDDGHDYTNRPNVAAKAEYVGRVGEPMEFTGWAHDFDKRIIAVEPAVKPPLTYSRTSPRC
ncbi:MAG: molybdopterin-dependent oxidoreductase [Adlercreutzia equolifaciens]|nr:molybdopterin-dependent oxidoreductase [Adlercreutzia equolifaciens]